MSAEPEIHAEPTDATWREIDDLVDRVADLSRAHVEPDVFYRELLDRTVRTLAAVGGAVWLAGQPGRLDLRYQIQFERLGLREPEEHARHQGLVATAVTGGTTRAFPPRSGSAGPDGFSNPTDFLLLVCPLMLDGEPIGALELVQRPQTDPAAYRGNERLLAMVGELALEYQRDRRLAAYRRRVEQSEQLDRFARRVHRPLDPEAVAYEIANEGRRLVDCDRLSVAVPGRRWLRLAAVSGADRFDPRSNLVRRLESLVRRVAASGESFWYAGDWEAVPPQLEAELRAYVDEGHVRSLAVIPLTMIEGDPDEDSDGTWSGNALSASSGTGSSGTGSFGAWSRRPGAVRSGAGESALSVVGALVVERFDAGLDDESRRRVATVAEHSRVALSNAGEYRSLPLLPLSRALRGLLGQFQADRLPRSLAVLLAAGLVVAVLSFVPAPFRVEARGQLQPLRNRNIFAPEDGEVRRLLVEHQQEVQADQPLLELVNMDLELALQRVETERLTTRKQLEAIGILRVTDDREADQPATRRDQLSAQELEVTQLLRSQERQVEIIHQQRKALEVRSPLAGRVLTWDLERLLSDRPVRRGELLMRVADLDGPWLAELEVPEHRIGHVLRTTERSGDDLAVSFILGTDPSHTYQARVMEIAETAVPDRDGRPVVMVKVRVKEAIPQRHPGATVIARIHCGRQPLGYVWLHDLIDTVRSYVLF